jgi:ribosome hibernation promoting factor
MQVMVTFRHVEPSAGLRRHAEKKVQRVRKLLREPVEAHVILSVIKHRHLAEVQLTADHLNLTATEETDDLYSAIDLAVGKIERQVGKRVDRHKDHKGAVGGAAPGTMTAPEPSTDYRIRRQRVAVKPMSVAEAVLQLKRSKSEFLVFKNAANESISVIYRRKDGNYGLIEPEPS